MDARERVECSVCDRYTGTEELVCDECSNLSHAWAREKAFKLGMAVGAALINWAQAIHDGPCTCRCKKRPNYVYKEDCPLHYTVSSFLTMLRVHVCPHRRTFCKHGNLCLGCSAGKKRREDDR
jgi:hypothetical protein